MAHKWNEKTKQYERYELPPGAACFSTDMDKLVSCAYCGNQITYGSGYTSRRIHTSMGLGYCICADCYEKEVSDLVN